MACWWMWNDAGCRSIGCSFCSIFFVGDENAIGLPLVRKKNALHGNLVDYYGYFFSEQDYFFNKKWRAKVTGCLVVNLHPFKDVGTVNL